MVSVRGRELTDYLERRKGSMLALLERLVVAESPSTVPGAFVAVHGILTAELQSLGFRVRRISGRKTGGHLLAVPESRQRNRPVQLMIGHCDTVWPTGMLDRMPLRRTGGRLTGPGVYDMKGGLVLMIFALQALSAVGLDPQLTPVVFINSDEEIGSPESGRYIEALAKRAKRVWVLEPALGRSGKIKTARKGVGSFSIRIFGRSAHAGLEPGKGVSAILELSHVVQELSRLNRSRSGVTLNVGTIGGGSRTNVVAAEAFLTVDVRFRTMNQWRGVEAAVHAIRPHARGARLDIDGKLVKPPFERTPGNRALWALARQIGRELDLELEEAQVGGASDGNSASIHSPTLDGLGPIGGGSHAEHEFVIVDSLVERAALLALLLAGPVGCTK